MGERFPVSNRAAEIFHDHFSKVLSAEDFERASKAFHMLAGYNERSFAMQLHTATQFGKLEEVLAAYDRMSAPDSWVHNVPDPVTLAAEMRGFADVIYAS